MSGATTSRLSARFLTADRLVQGRDNPLSCPLWQSGALVAPTQSGSTVSIWDSSNNVIVSGAAVTVTGNIATYTLLAALVPSTLSRGMGWRVEWSLVVNGVTTVYRNAAGLIRSELAPCITDDDLYGRESSLDPDGDAPIHKLTTFQEKIDAAWVMIDGLLVAKGSLPHLVMEPAALREPHILLTLHLIFEDFRTRLNESWAEKAKDYKTEWKDAWSDLRFEYDSTDSGQSDGRRKRSASATVWLCGTG